MTNETNPSEKHAHRATQGLDPGRVDERCQVVEVPLASGQSVSVSLRTVAPLSEREQALLGDVVRAVAARMEREHPHAGVVQELMLAWSQLRIQPGLLGATGHVGAVKDRVSAAIRGVRVALDATQAGLVAARGWEAELAEARESRFRWAEEAAELAEQVEQARFERSYWRDLVSANLSDLLRGMAARATRLRRATSRPEPFTMDNPAPGSCDSHNPDLCTGCNWEPATCCACNEEIEHGERAFMLSQPEYPYLGDEHEDQEWRVVQWHAKCDERAQGGGWPCRCGTDEADMVHTPERCYSASEPITAPVSAIVHRATGERHDYRQRPRTHEGRGKGPVD